MFPHGTPGGDAFARALAQRVLPHLERLVLHGERAAEHVVAFAPSVRFDAARAAGCFGAAPLRDALTRLAPYRYARRFSRAGAPCASTRRTPSAAGRRRAPRAQSTVAPARRDAEALAWYGDAPSAHDLRADVAIVGPDGDAGDAACVLRLDDALRDGAHGDAHAVEIVDSLPLDVGTPSTPADGPARRWFAVERAPEPAPRALPDVTYRAAGGSAGRIAVILGRNGALLQPSADTDEARALVAALRAEGFDAILAESPEELDGADLVHAIGTRDACACARGSPPPLPPRAGSARPRAPAAVRSGHSAHRRARPTARRTNPSAGGSCR